MLGNEAIARGAYEAGVKVTSAYPGTPSTEVSENVVKYDGVYAEWAPNEKVAAEVAIGASMAGIRSMTMMKMVGLNVAADPLYSGAYIGVNGGMVVVVADDPGIYSSQNEQDTRMVGRASMIPVIEPSDSEEARVFTKRAYELSEEYDTPIILRTTTRLAHSQGLVNLEDRVEVDDKPYERNIAKNVMMPGNAIKRHIHVEERLKRMAEDAGWQGAYTAFLGPDPLALLFVVILTSLGTWGLPQMVGKFYAINSEKDIHKGTVISTVFAIIVAGGCYFLGGFGRLYGDKIAINPQTGKPLFDTIIPTMLSTLPALVVAIVIVLVLSASMSTLSSLVLTSSSTFTLDVIKPASKKEMSDKKQVTIMRFFIVFFIFISAVIAIFKDSHPEVTFIAQMMGVSWGALAGAFLAPFLYGLYWKGVTKTATVVCFVWGCGIAIVQLIITLCGIDITGWGTILSYIFKSSINSGVIAMVGGLIIVPIISLFTKKQDRKEVDDLFKCYEEKTEAVAKEHLK